jgi:hypothetical protein
VPGPGQYAIQSSVVIKEATREMASYKSGSNRTVGKSPELPGVGQYNLTDYLSVSNK